MSLNDEFSALPLKHRTIILLAGMALALLFGALAGFHRESGPEIGLAGGCGLGAVYAIVMRVVVYIFVRKTVRGIKREEAEEAEARRLATVRSTSATRERAGRGAHLSSAPARRGRRPFGRRRPDRP